MTSYLVRRLLDTIVVMLIITLLVFFAIRLTGNPVDAMLMGIKPTHQAIAFLTHQLGLDKPVWLQYAFFLKDTLTGNLGHSLFSGQSVWSLVKLHLGVTLLLTMAGIVVAAVIALPVGVLAAMYRGTWVDVLGRTFSIIGVCFPSFWLGIMLILVFAVLLHWLPVAGFGYVHHLVLPAVTLGLSLAGILAGLIRSSMIEVLSQDYVRTARAKGVREWRVVMRHCLRNALLPVITYLGLQFGTLLGGVVILEQVFSWPGVGQLMIQSIDARDYPVVQGATLVLAFLLILVNLLVDLSYVFIDPRIRFGGE